MAASGPKMMKKPTYHRMKNIWLVVQFKETISYGTSAIPQKRFMVYRKQLLYDLIRVALKALGVPFYFFYATRCKSRATY
jgi:hypothetical protein